MLSECIHDQLHRGPEGGEIEGNMQAPSGVRAHRERSHGAGQNSNRRTRYFEAGFLTVTDPWNPTFQALEQMHEEHGDSELQFEVSHNGQHTVSVPTSKDSKRLEKAIT